MKLLTKEIEKKFEHYPMNSQEDKGMNAEVLVKYFNPYGVGTWLITEAEKVDDDYLLFGYCHIFEWEWGSIYLSEIMNATVNVFGEEMHLERELYSEGKTVAELVNQ